MYSILFYQAEITQIFSDEGMVSYMLQTEAALAQAQAKLGVIPAVAAEHIIAVAQRPVILQFHWSSNSLLPLKKLMKMPRAMSIGVQQARTLLILPVFYSVEML